MHQESWRRQLYATSFAILVSLAYLQISALGGRLAADLTYDDVVYANDAARRLLSVADSGLFALLRGLVEAPPHSPYSTLLAVAAFAVGGLNEFAMYAANALILVAIAAFATHELRHARNVLIVLGVCILLLSPIAYQAIHDFRPDIALGFATASMVWWFIGGLVEGDSRQFRRAGYALGACLLIKPSFFVHTLAIVLFLLLLAVIAGLLEKRRIAMIAPLDMRTLGCFVGVGILISAPYYIANGSQILKYFWDNTRGEESAIWSFATTTPIRDLLAYYVWD